MRVKKSQLEVINHFIKAWKYYMGGKHEIRYLQGFGISKLISSNHVMCYNCEKKPAKWEFNIGNIKTAYPVRVCSKKCHAYFMFKVGLA